MARKTKKSKQEQAEPPEEGELSVEERLAAAEADRDEYLQRWQRAQADYQNFKRREQSAVEDRVRRRMQPLLERMLLVLDYLDMALATPATNEESKNLAMGVRLTRDQFLSALEQDDVQPIPEGGTFDPSRHEATGTEVNAEVEPGTIVSTARRGYLWGETVLRHAHVVVAQGPGEAAPEAARASGESADPDGSASSGREDGETEPPADDAPPQED